jgi:hypothetical protein
MNLGIKQDQRRISYENPWFVIRGPVTPKDGFPDVRERVDSLGAVGKLQHNI